MDFKKLNNDVEMAFETMKKEFGGQRLVGRLEVGTFEPLSALAELGSKVFTEKYKSFGPDIGPFNYRENPLPEGTFFRAEVVKRPDRDDLYLAAIFESGGHYSLISHFETNDQEYVDSHPWLDWRPKEDRSKSQESDQVHD